METVNRMYRLKGTMLSLPLDELQKMVKLGYAKRLDDDFIITTKGQMMMKSAEKAMLN